MEVEVLLAVKDHPEQLVRDDGQGGHAHRLERGDDREDGRRELARCVLRDRVVRRGRVGGDAVLLDGELDRLGGLADGSGLERGRLGAVSVDMAGP